MREHRPRGVAFCLHLDFMQSVLLIWLASHLMLADLVLKKFSTIQYLYDSCFCTLYFPRTQWVNPNYQSDTFRRIQCQKNKKLVKNWYKFSHHQEWSYFSFKNWRLWLHSCYKSFGPASHMTICLINCS